MKTVDYLDVPLKLNDGRYRFFHKPNEETTRIYVEFNHPLQILKNIPKTIEKDYPIYLHQKEIFEIGKITMTSIYKNQDITKK